MILSRLQREEDINQLRLPKPIKLYISEGCEDFQAEMALAQNNNNAKIQFTHW